MATNKKRMINLLPMGIPPYIFYIYTILDSDARKIFNSPSPCLSPRRLFHNSPFTLRHAQGERLSSLFLTCRSPFVVSPSIYRSSGGSRRMNGSLRTGFSNHERSKYPPAKLGALRLLAPQRGLSAIAKESNPPSSPFVKRGKDFSSLWSPTQSGL